MVLGQDSDDNARTSIVDVEGDEPHIRMECKRILHCLSLPNLHTLQLCVQQFFFLQS